MATAQQQESKKGSHLAPWQFKPGQSGNPKGRKPGKSLKEYAQEMLSKMTDDERQEYLRGLPKEVIWKMAEGNPTDKMVADLAVSVEVSEKVKHKHDTHTRSK